ncbi:uncharacterized protein LOC124806039 [Hydra vulgaris]|uniref:uncharacterized protein LOC124806039 n=1 Tax=Hydra vulgaris TaxID=6087 RepID=UPI001F5F49CD|nr:uncharacterized protein LOC124806039 [Hydra vulgaris]
MKIFYFLAFASTAAFFDSHLTCPQYPPPNNGRMICDHLLGKYCTPSCNFGFVPNGPQAWAYVCNPVTQRWGTYPDSYPLPWPDCVAPKDQTWNPKSFYILNKIKEPDLENVNGDKSVGDLEKSYEEDKQIKGEKKTQTEFYKNNITDSAYDILKVASKNRLKNKVQKQFEVLNDTPSDNGSTSKTSSKKTDTLSQPPSQKNNSNKSSNTRDNKSYVPMSSSFNENESYEAVDKLINNRTNERQIDITKVTKTRNFGTKEIDIEDLKITTTRDNVANIDNGKSLNETTVFVHSLPKDNVDQKSIVLDNNKDSTGISENLLNKKSIPSAFNNITTHAINSITPLATNISIITQQFNEENTKNENLAVKTIKNNTKQVIDLQTRTLDSLSVEQELRNITDTLREIGQSIKSSIVAKTSPLLPTTLTISKLDNTTINNIKESNKSSTHQTADKSYHAANHTLRKTYNLSKKTSTIKDKKKHTALKKLSYETEQIKANQFNNIKSFIKDSEQKQDDNDKEANNEPPLVPVFSNKDLSLLRHMVSTNNKRSEMRHSSPSLWSKMMTLTSTKDDHQLRRAKLASRKKLATEDLNLAKLIMTGINNKDNYHFKDKPNPFLYSGKSLGPMNQSKLKTDKASTRQYVWNGATFVPLSENEPSTSYLHSNEGGGLSSTSRYRWNGATFVPTDLSEELSLIQSQNSQLSSLPSQSQNIQTEFHPVAVDTFPELAAVPTQTDRLGEIIKTDLAKEESDVTRTPAIMTNKEVQKILDIWNGSPEILAEKTPIEFKSTESTPIEFKSKEPINSQMLNKEKIIFFPTQQPKYMETTQQFPLIPVTMKTTTFKTEFFSKPIEINGQTYVPLTPNAQIDPENKEDDLLYWDGKHYVPIKYQKVTVPGTILYKLENGIYMPTYYNGGNMLDNLVQTNFPAAETKLKAESSEAKLQNEPSNTMGVFQHTENTEKVIYPERPPSLSQARDFNDRAVAGPPPTNPPPTSKNKLSSSNFYANNTIQWEKTTSIKFKPTSFNLVTSTTTAIPLTETTHVVLTTETTMTPYTTSTELKHDILQEYSKQPQQVNHAADDSLREYTKQLPPINPSPDDPFREDVEDLGNIIKTDLGIKNEIESLTKLFEADSKETPVTIPITHGKTISDIRLLMPSLFGPEEEPSISNSKPEMSLAEKDLQIADQLLKKEEEERKFPIPSTVIKGNDEEAIKSGQLKELIEKKERTALENLSNKEKYDLEKTLSSDIQKLQSTFDKDHTVLLPSIRLDKDPPNLLAASDLNVGDIRDLLKITKLAEKSASKKHGLLKPSLTRSQARKVLEKGGVQQLLKYLILSGTSPSTIAALREKNLRKKILPELKFSDHAKEESVLNAKDTEELRKVNEQWDRRYKGLQKTIDHKAKNPLPKFGRKKRSEKKRKKRDNRL